MGENGLVTDIRFNNTVCDISGRQNHGTIYGSTFVGSPLGRAIKFQSSSDYVELTSNKNPHSGSKLTVEIIARANNLPTSSNYIFAKGDDYTSKPGYGILLNNTNYVLFMCNGTGASPSWLSSTNIITLNKYFHIIGIINGNSRTLIVNGVSVSDTYTGTLGDATNSLRIGQQNRSGYYYPFLGEIVLIRFWNKVLIPPKWQWVNYLNKDKTNVQ